MKKGFLSVGHLPTLFASFFYFDMSFMVWVLLGPLGVQIAKDLDLSPAQKGFMVAVPVLSGALLRIVAGIMVDRLRPKLTGIILQVIVIASLLTAWFVGVHSFEATLAVGLALGVAGASFAVANGRATAKDAPATPSASPTARVASNECTPTNHAVSRLAMTITCRMMPVSFGRSRSTMMPATMRNSAPESTGTATMNPFCAGDRSRSLAI